MLLITDVIISAPSELVHLEKDYLDLEWYEAGKTIIRRNSRMGREIAIKKQTTPALEDGDLLFLAEDWCLLVNIIPCDCIVLKPVTMSEMAAVCFEIGNQHIPIFLTESDAICIAYEAPLYSMLEKAGFCPVIEHRKLLKMHALKLNQKNERQPFSL
ncbi:MAG: Urease accessory protein UreE [Bacteroidota bacterium]